MCFTGYVAWLLKQERESHDRTRSQMTELGEKRLALHVENVGMLKDLRVSLDGVRGELHEVKTELSRRRRA